MSWQSDKDIESARQIIRNCLSGTWRGEPSSDLRMALQYLLWWDGHRLIERYVKVLQPAQPNEERIGPVYYENQPLWLSKEHTCLLLEF